ncbi:MAG: M14 family metallopeptidase [Opitutaceae bacterium]
MRVRISFLLLFPSFLLSISPPVRAEAPPTPSLRYFFPDESVTCDERVPEPESFFGFEIGEWHLQHHELLAYYRALAAAAPDRVLLEEIGETYGRRKIVLLTITSPENHSRLDAIRAANLKNALGEKKAPANAPAVVWLGYTIHGNEPSGANAAPLVAYHLAAGRGPAVDRLLEHAVVLVDPLLNPDGADRFAAWSNNNRGRLPNPDPSHREHQEGWLSGRTNYYWLDLNRDWLPAVMPASQAHLATFHRWRPAVFCDFHEMSSSETYFFQPGITKMVNPITPSENQALTLRLAQEHAKALDAIGSLYFTGERYDDFYIGKGSTYPDLQGSVGILFEQASARGHSQETENGLLTLRFAVRNQVRTSLSSLRGAAGARADLLAHQFKAATSALKEADAAAVAAYAFAAPGDPARLARFATLLKRHHIRFRPLTRDLTQGGVTFAAGFSIIVPATQPAYRFITAMFEKRTEFASPAFYDVSAWNMAEAFGLVWSPLESVPAANALGRLNETPPHAATFDARESGIALAFSWTHYHAPRAAHRFFEAGARLRVAMEPFTAATPDGEAPMPAGTIVVPYGIQPIDRSLIDDVASRIAAEDSVPVTRIISGLTPAGIDIGSGSMGALEEPRIALVVGEGANTYAAGEVWHLLDRDLAIPTSLVESERLSASHIFEYNTIIFSDGRFQATETLKTWVEHGGTLIVTGGAIRGLETAKWIPLETTKADFERARVPFSSAREDAATRLIAGSIIEARMDLTHPIAFGYTSERAALMRNRDIFLAPAKNPFSSPVLYTENPLVSGYIAGPNLKALAGSAAVQVHHLQRGRIILMPDAPAFRSHWIGSAKLLINAIHFGPLMREAGYRPD